jgi:GNAT superfamily N-acetyltransferase
MIEPTIIIDEHPDPALRESILRPLRDYNESKVGPSTSELVAILLRHPESGEIIGGLWGRSVRDWLFVDLLFVPEELRARGLGSSIMKKAEEVATKRGCAGVWLHSGTFQASDFYEKLGYQSFGKLRDFPKGHDTIYYFKRVDDQSQST